jgi:hypothetical protein
LGRGYFTPCPIRGKMVTAKEVLRQLRPAFGKDTLFTRINRIYRPFYIALQERALRQLTKLARFYPEPERALVRKYNSFVWLDIFDEYLEYERNPRILDLVQDLRRAFIGKIESCNNYSERIDVLVEMIARKYNEGAFKKRRSHTPGNDWVEPSVIEAKQVILTSMGEHTFRRAKEN